MQTILKFGGTSISYSGGLSKVIEIVRKKSEKNSPLTVIISAFAGQTDKLLALVETANTKLIEEIKDYHINLASEFSAEPNKVLKIIEELKAEKIENSPESKDRILGYGERLSLAILSEVFTKNFSDFDAVDSRDFICTNEDFGSASIDFELSEKKVKEKFSGKKNIITNGFIGRSPSGKTTTLGRGGSDYTATFIAYALNAKSIEIYTAVDGVLTADPKRVNSAFKLPQLSYEEAIELCHFGSKVIFPRAIQPALEKQIPIYIKNYQSPEAAGTLISKTPPPENFLVTGISSISDVSLLRLEGSGLYGVAGIAKRLFAALSDKNISVILISQASSESSICFAIPSSSTKVAEQTINQAFKEEIAAHLVRPVSIDSDLCIVAIVGANMRRTPGISGRAFQALGKNGINAAAIAQGSSELNISIVISKADEDKAINALHDAFFLSGVTTIHLFQMGVGQVGKKLLEQISENQEFFLKRGAQIKLVGVANSKSFAISKDGIKDWDNSLKSGKAGGVNDFLATIKELNLPNSIFVDCTASEEVGNTYEKFLDSSISIVTPNKKANSSSYERYKALKVIAKKRNVKFFYETNVGAGLPVISTLNDLLISGDKVIKIEAVLSGTLSYIFNTFNSETKFSDVVKKAKAEGYTEPDPRDDLSGTDVARKLLILAREIGIGLELKDINVQSLVPKECESCKSGDEFLAKLPEHDGYFADIANKAKLENKVLRFIGKIESGKAEVSLQAVDSNHPFYSLSGSDNIISFVTERYLNRPLVVKGPGAGTDVTAAGVLADILRVASYLA